MFELKTKTPAIITSVTPRIEKHGEDNVPAISLGIKITGPNTLLDLLSPGLREVLYKAVDNQDNLPGVEQSMPLLRSRAFETIKVKMPTMEGWRLWVEHGIDDDSAIDLHSCKVDKVTAEPFEGGSCEIKFRVGTSDVDDRYMGALAMALGSEVPITLLAPKPMKPAIDGSTGAFEADHPEAGAGDLFADKAGLMGDGRDDPPPQSSDDETPEPDPVAQEAAEFEAGAAQAVQNARRGRRSSAAME